MLDRWYCLVEEIFLELTKTLKSLGDSAKSDQLISLALPITSNFEVRGKQPCIAWVSPFQQVSQLAKNASGAPAQDQSRTLDLVLDLLRGTPSIPNTSPEVPKSNLHQLKAPNM